MNTEGLVCVSVCNKITQENAHSCSEHCVEEADSWNDLCFYMPWIASEEFTGQIKNL
jgi:hypothetical protein